MATGVELQQIQSIRDQVLSFQNCGGDAATEQRAGAIERLQQVQALFSSSTQGIGADFSAFFNSLSQLIDQPDQHPGPAGGAECRAKRRQRFQPAAANLNSVSSGLNSNRQPGRVSQINDLTQQIAQLNGQVAIMQKEGKDPGTLKIRRIS